MVKCIASDMDGTLVNTRHTISEENAEAIRAAQSKGVEVVVATGRSYEEAHFVLEEADISCPIICVNGAEVRSAEGEKIYSIPMDSHDAKNIASLLKSLDIYFEVYTNRGTYSEDYEKALSVILDIFMSANEKQDYEKALEGAKERFEKGRVHLIESYASLLEDEEIEIYKLLAFSFDGQRLAKAEEKLQENGQIAVSSSGFENLEITHIDAQKGIALSNFVEKKGISLSETMAVGDSYNDISMFKVVGKAVAMGNAPEEIQQMCHMVTATNHENENGVAKAIMQAISENR
ncbi:Cof subfamily protein (haloacid dehalogenase superfamily) [Bacillus fengqiuensis]|nr:Cof subfamily protein (haloacid dehalogenase superfamily) [Bacillus fengqiuensis]